MSLVIDDSDLLAGLARWQRAQSAAIDVGLWAGADRVQAEMQSTQAHGDRSGATRASYRAYVIGNGYDGAAESADGFAAAQTAIERFAGQGGQAMSEPCGVTLGLGERGLLATAFTNYQDEIETTRGGEMAVIGPVILAESSSITGGVARALRNI